ARMALVALALPGCSSPATALDTLPGEAADLRPLELASGTSFGMCMGYCTTELTITDAQVTLRGLGRPETRPARTRSLPLEPEARARIGALVDRAQRDRCARWRATPRGWGWARADRARGAPARRRSLPSPCASS